MVGKRFYLGVCHFLANTLKGVATRTKFASSGFKFIAGAGRLRTISLTRIGCGRAYYKTYFLLTLVTVFIVLIISPVLGQSQVTVPVQSLSKSQESLQDLLQQGKVLFEAGRLVEAQAVLQKVSQQYQVLGDKLRQAMTLSNLALVYQQRGMFAEANKAINNSLQLLGTHSKQHLQVQAQTLEIQGSLQLEQGQAEVALKTWQRAIDTYTQIGDKSGMTRSRINQAQALQVLGFYRRALTSLTELSNDLQSQPDSLTKVVELRSLGDTLQLTGDLDKSRQVLLKSLELAQRLKYTPEISATLLSLGNTARLQQDYQGAIAFYHQVIATNPAPLTKVQAQINLINVLIKTNKAAIIPSILTQIETEIEKLPLSQVAVYARVHLAQSLMKECVGARQCRAPTDRYSTPEKIAQLLATGVQQAKALGDKRAESYALGTLGKLYEQEKQWKNAQKLTQQALVLAQLVNAPDIAYNWHWQMGRLLKQQGNIPAAIAAYDAAYEELQSIRSDLVAVNRDVQFSFRESVEPVYRESVALLLQPRGEKLSEKTLDKARQRIEALQLAELDNFFREACLNVTKVVLDKVVEQDSPTTAVIYPIILPDQLQVIVKIPKLPLRHFSVNKSQTEVENILGQLRQYLNEPDTIEEVQSLSLQLYSWLIQPIDSELQRSKVNTLVFVLDGALRSVPMASLYDGKQYLIEKYAVALNLGLQLQTPKPLTQQKLQVLAGGLVQPPPNFPQFPPLPEIISEFNLIARSGVSTTKLLNQNFTSKTLQGKINASGFNVVHLATHGQFSSRSEDTFILTADGPINVSDFDLLLRRRDETRPEAIEMLVLSACQTAAGDNRATLGLAGVGIRAGARSTLASLWNVGDRSTAILMGEFYRELTTAKVTKAEALRRAQVTLLQKYPNYSRPGYWAAYVLIGNWL
ncbi:CHAT domain-containing protein [Iningainema tapete]|uniref:CHAT domain-containing protein n=1 Tax=Iningainema tapete BLCC-T55 TaxID=2748662 RepID=A0A8J6XV47_9CYAN|nr:CHAT domain-containing protein [Iningainema tapete]MBD2774253.1 CHAT domain-containing protein [Iningainema tapete BLCC-T55]